MGAPIIQYTFSYVLVGSKYFTALCSLICVICFTERWENGAIFFTFLSDVHQPSFLLFWQKCIQSLWSNSLPKCRDPKGNPDDPPALVSVTTAAQCLSVVEILPHNFVVLWRHCVIAWHVTSWHDTLRHGMTRYVMASKCTRCLQIIASLVQCPEGVKLLVPWDSGCGTVGRGLEAPSSNLVINKHFACVKC